MQCWHVVRKDPSRIGVDVQHLDGSQECRIERGAGRKVLVTMRWAKDWKVEVVELAINYRGDSIGVVIDVDLIEADIVGNTNLLLQDFVIKSLKALWILWEG